MRVLLLGASGFIGRELFAALNKRGHRVIAAVRDVDRAPAFASEPPVVVDLDRDTSVEAWMPRLAGIDAVVNCAGVLQGTRTQSMDAIHKAAPIALFEACERCGVRRVVQISAISADREAGSEYALTKLAADDHLRASALQWVVVRPSLVLARGAYGGTAVLRAIAALPFAVPVPGTGSQQFQPIHVDDLSRVVALALESDSLVCRTVDAVGPDVVTLRSLLEDYRRWLGFGTAPVIPIPALLVRAIARLGDHLGGPLNSTSLRQLEYGNTGDYAAFVRLTAGDAQGWRAALADHPAHTQDRWHARIYFIRPLLRFTLGALWLVSGFAGAFALMPWATLFATQLRISTAAAATVLALACILDIAIALLVLRRWKPRLLALAQVAVIAVYTLVATWLWPSLWAESLGPLLKNLPIVAAVLALGAIEEER
jgi:uncharacterized protein YbjT (DUF2867 family)/uncharacterized membrane protein YphA (DoxX/SURF4 family)